MKWSPEQWQAIALSHKNLLVSAAAGSGKTAVLVNRILRHLLAREEGVEPWDVDRLLVVTFTRAAAAEMRARIESELQKAIAADPGDERLERQLVLLSNASISTLHSFCQTVIRQNFAAIDLDPQFRLANEQELVLMRQDVLEELFEQKYEAGEEGFLHFADAYGSERGDDVLYDIVQSLYDYAQSETFPERWLESLAACFALPDGARLKDTVWMPVIRAAVESSLGKCREALRAFQATIAGLGAEEQPFYEEMVAVAAASLERIEAGLDAGWDETRLAFAAMDFKTFRGQPKTIEAEDKARLSELHNTDIKKQLEKLRDRFFLEEEAVLLEDLRAEAPVMQTVTALAAEFGQAFAAAKREKNLLDFNDLEHFSLQILGTPDADGKLQPTPAAQALQERFQEIMVDEYQDTNGVQEAILSLVVHPGRANLFTVGDVKQSIYRFRLADPSLFLEKYRRYPVLGERYARIDLTRNFRSRASVLGAINFLFVQLMVPESMELTYDAAAALYPGAAYPELPAEQSLDGAAELIIIDREDDAAAEDSSMDGSEEQEELRGFALEAQYIARRLRELAGAGKQVFDKETGTYRSLCWRDIVILLRSRKNKADVLLDALRTADIPAYASVNDGYFAETEIQVMLALLSVIDNARQDIPLAAVLYSPIGGLTAAELAELRIAAPQEDLFGALLQANAPESTCSAELREKAEHFLRQLTGWRNLARRSSVPELIWQLYRDTGYYDYAGGMPGGLLRQANLRMLCDRAADYEKTNFRGLFRFLRFIEKMQKMETDLAVARTLSENEDVVRIMTIHESKGLEFPVVVLADIGKQFNLQDLYAPLLMHRELGLGPRRVDLEKSVRYPTFARQAIALRMTQENKAEEMRVLYVALTRAREKLILVGSVNKGLQKRATEWCRFREYPGTPLPGYAPLDASSYLDWIAAAVARHADGQVLWSLADVAPGAAPLDYAQDAHWDVQVIPAGELQAEAPAAASVDAIFAAIRQQEPLPVEAAVPEIRQRLDWHYDFCGVQEVPAKLSVTELKQRFSEKTAEREARPLVSARTELFSRPAFLQEERHLKGNEYGTIMHSVMQHMDLQQTLDAANIEAQLAMLVEKEVLLPEQQAVVPIRAVQRFFSSSLGQRMRNASRLWREMPFSRMLPARRFYPAVEDTAEKIFSQGIIDVLFEEADGQLVLLDYKTDRDTRPDRIQERYHLQLELYSEAVEALMGKRIKERYLYMLHDGSVVEV